MKQKLYTFLMAFFAITTGAFAQVTVPTAASLNFNDDATATSGQIVVTAYNLIESTKEGGYIEFAINTLTTGDYNVVIRAGTAKNNSSISVGTYSGDETEPASTTSENIINDGDWNSDNLYYFPISLMSGTTYTLRVNFHNSAADWCANVHSIIVETATGSIDATLATLSVDGATLSPAFDANILEYTVVLPNVGETTATINATANDANAQSVTGTGTLNLPEGRNHFELVVTAEAGNTLTYNVKIINPIKVSHEKDLAMLTNVIVVPEYRAPAATDDRINYWAPNEYMEYYIYSTEDADLTFAVNAANGGTTDGSEISSLNVSTYTYGAGWTIDDTQTKIIPNNDGDWSIASATEVYFDVNLVANTPVVLRLHCVSKIHANSLANVYNFTFYEPLSNPTLSEIKIDDVDLQGFDPEELTYTVSLPAGTTVIPTVSATATAHENVSSVTVTDATALPGSATILVEAGGESATITINFDFATATEEVTADFKVYPNPVSDVLRINAKNQVLKVQIYSSTGAVVKSLSGNITSVNVSDIASGIYFIAVTTEEGTATQKITVQ